MTSNVALSFSIQPLSDNPEVSALMPIVNGISLAEMIASFERQSGFEPAGGYGGLVPEFYDYGRLINTFWVNATRMNG
jgi:hypothetical protein